MKEPRLGSQLKGRAGDLNRASPYGRWPVTLLLTQLKQTQTLLGYSKHAHWAWSRLQHSWFDGPEAKYMHSGTNLLSDAHTRPSHWKPPGGTELVNYTRLSSCVFYLFIFELKCILTGLLNWGAKPQRRKMLIRHAQAVQFAYHKK